MSIETISIKRAVVRVTVAALVIVAIGVATEAQDEFDEEAYSAFDSLLMSINWVIGPDTASIGSIGQIAVPEGFSFTGQEGAQALMEAFENPLSGLEQGFLCPQTFAWWAVLEWDPVGYVKDDDKEDLDADEMLKALREGTKEGNKERRKRGWSTLEIAGWAQPPHYEESSHNLAWATIIEGSNGYRNVNHNSRVLGRRGMMLVTLVTDVDSLDYYLPEFRRAMAGLSYLPGETYAEYREGDGLAEYGLTALVVGGGAAVAAKTGLFKWIWKLLVIAAISAAGFFKKLFGKKNKLPPTTPGT